MPMYFSEGSIGGDIERVSTDKIEAFYEMKKVAYEDRPMELLEPQGSNGFAISGQLTESEMPCFSLIHTLLFIFRGEVHAVE